MVMSILPNMYKYISSLFLLFLSFQVLAQTDSSAKKNDHVFIANEHQLRLGFDMSKPVMNLLYKTKYGYEFSLDYDTRKDIYLVAEGGFGGSEINYNDLKYSSTNTFYKIGIDKSMLQRMFPGDWDYLFVGLRYGIAFINRKEATFITNDNFWGTTVGTIPATSFTGHWAEITAGLRVELLKGLFAGYTVRAKFLLNQNTFKELPPAYIAGYGKGDKNTSFDFNFYLQYALRWKKKTH